MSDSKKGTRPAAPCLRLRQRNSHAFHGPVRRRLAKEKTLRTFQVEAMAALAAGLPGAVRALPVRDGARVRVSRPRSSFWTHSVVVDPSPFEGPLFLKLDDLALARDSVQALLRPQLPFHIKVVVVCSMLRTTREGGVERARTGFDLAPWKVLPRSNVDERMAHIIAAARNKFEKHLENLRFRETDWTVEGIGLRALATPSTELLNLPAPGVAAEIVEAQVGVNRSVHKLPPELSNRKGIWNPQNKDASCFRLVRARRRAGHQQGGAARPAEQRQLWRLLLHEGPPSRQAQAPPHGEGAQEWRLGLLEPAHGPRRYLRNWGKVQVFVRSWLDVTWRGHRYPCAPKVRTPTVPWAPLTVELLLYREAPDQEHYMLIYDSNKFDGRRGARLGECRKQSHKGCFRCPRCTRPFPYREDLEEHMQSVCSEHPGERFSTIRMPDSEKPSERELRFKASGACEMAPQMTYVDAEVFSQKPPDGLEGGSTHRKQHGFQDHLSEQHKMWMDHCEAGDKPNDLAERFFQLATGPVLRVPGVEADGEQGASLPGTDAEKQAAERCQLCRARFQHVGKRTKCWHHRHGTGEYLGALRSSCNGAAQQPRHLTFVLHNGGGYDFHFLLRAAARLRNAAQDEGEDDGRFRVRRSGARSPETGAR